MSPQYAAAKQRQRHKPAIGKTHEQWRHEPPKAKRTNRNAGERVCRPGDQLQSLSALATPRIGQPRRAATNTHTHRIDQQTAMQSAENTAKCAITQ